ncbi:MAG TPA: Fic family protein [Candidatus Paceibacterota bacterium]|nr:Fic family protein [Candidatus Paceibacterota bacterium]HMO82826.1 Fic family protein [Candidatus Paceibacterota bacterium]
MIRLGQKKSRNTMYFYLTERVFVNGSFKKIQVFLGKNVPTDTRRFYATLQKKELAQLSKKNLYSASSLLPSHYHKIELFRLNWKYFTAQLSDAKIQKLMNQFAITFIYESNAIEGSRLSQQEVEAIIKKQYVKKSLPRHEVEEAENAIRAFNLIQTTDFTLTQKNLKLLHSIVTEKLNVPRGFKKENIVVNNKQTAAPKDVRIELQKLFTWYKNSKSTVHPFERAVIFHNRFEHIHPFTDGNGRVGRLILNWMLIKDGYGVILVRNRNRISYFSALAKGDEGRYRNLLTLASKAYVDTITELTK